MKCKIPASLPQRKRQQQNADKPGRRSSGHLRCRSVLKRGGRVTPPLPNYNHLCEERNAGFSRRRKLPALDNADLKGIKPAQVTNKETHILQSGFLLLFGMSPEPRQKKGEEARTCRSSLLCPRVAADGFFYKRSVQGHMCEQMHLCLSVKYLLGEGTAIKHRGT